MIRSPGSVSRIVSTDWRMRAIPSSRPSPAGRSGNRHPVPIHSSTTSTMGRSWAALRHRAVACPRPVEPPGGSGSRYAATALAVLGRRPAEPLALDLRPDRLLLAEPAVLLGRHDLTGGPDDDLPVDGQDTALVAAALAAALADHVPPVVAEPPAVPVDEPDARVAEEVAEH